MTFPSPFQIYKILAEPLMNVESLKLKTRSKLSVSPLGPYIPQRVLASV